MRFSIFTLTALFSAITASAESCVEGFDYCGYTLLRTDPTYSAPIASQLETAGRPISDMQMSQSLFACGADGEIVYKKYCINGCGRIMEEVNEECYRK